MVDPFQAEMNCEDLYKIFNFFGSSRLRNSEGQIVKKDVFLAFSSAFSNPHPNGLKG
jgi:hypothetical protein|tara:strand:- start:242 stop:412 length:171 start_codon:yes stop_codon:yes gene_type:complete